MSLPKVMQAFLCLAMVIFLDYWLLAPCQNSANTLKGKVAWMKSYFLSLTFAPKILASLVSDILYANVVFLSFFSKFIFWGARVQVREGQRERKTESEAGSRLWPVSTEPDVGLELTNCEVMTWAKFGPLTNWATQVPPEARFLKLVSTTLS